jgi:hypothetical protein
LALVCWPSYCAMLSSQEMNLKSCLRERRGRPTNPSSGQAPTITLLRHLMLIACHSEAALDLLPRLDIMHELVSMAVLMT